MDEVDGMAGNEDRGGMQGLIAIPVICICNDRQHQKIRSLANYCYDLKFSKPRVEQIRGAIIRQKSIFGRRAPQDEHPRQDGLLSPGLHI